MPTVRVIKNYSIDVLIDILYTLIRDLNEANVAQLDRARDFKMGETPKRSLYRER